MDAGGPGYDTFASIPAWAQLRRLKYVPLLLLHCASP